MLESAAMWNLHLIYRLSHVPERFDDDVLSSTRPCGRDPRGRCPVA